VPDSADQDSASRHVKQDPIITHAQPVGAIGILEALDVPVQSSLQPLDFPKDLRGLRPGDALKVLER